MQVQVGRPSALSARAPFDIAIRASNLAEQIHAVQALRGDAGPGAGDAALSSVDSWRLRRLARGLAAAAGDAAGAGDRLEAILTTHRSMALRPGGRSPAEQSLLADLHASWLPTYVAALEGFDAPSDTDPDPVSQTESRPWLAQACAPFRQLLRRELGTVVDETNAALGREVIGPAIAAAFEEHLLERFKLPLAWAIEADQNVAFAQVGLDADTAGADDHEAYLRRTFGDAAACHTFLLRFPVLARWLSTVTRDLCDNGRRVVQRLARDVDEIGLTLFAEPILAFTSLQLGRSDHHDGGCSVAFVGVLLESGPETLVYKPRPLGSERATQDLLARLTDDGIVGFALRRVLAKDGYGYEERIRSGRNHVGSSAQAARVHEELGGFLAIFYVLGGSDLHYENVLVADGHVFVCDCETVLGVAVPGEQPATGTVLDSVYRTGLLEWPLPVNAGAVLRLSATAGGESYDMPFALARLQEGRAPAVRYESGVRVQESGANRVMLDGELVEARDHEAAIVQGFRAVHDWFRHAPDAGERIASLFAGTEVRFVPRSTQIYAQLLSVSRHPRCLVEPLEVDLVFGRLGENPHRWDVDGAAAAMEARSLWQLDVPTFAAPADGTGLVHDHRVDVGIELERSPLQLALDRIGTLSDDERERQFGYIAGSLTVAEVHSDSFVATALDYAQLVGDDLCRLFADPPRPARWTHSRGPEEEHIKRSLYYGSAGVALFLAYLDSIRPDEKVRRAAELALADAVERVPAGIGAFEGLSGRIYLLTHLAELWGDRGLLAQARDTSRKVDALIETDRDFDVLKGSAGVIAVMLGLQDACGEGLATAHRCARHLLSHAASAGRGLSWPLADPAVALANLTGFAHGAAGVGWALIALGARSGQEEYVQAGREAFAYERLYFDEERRDWYDLRTSMLERTNGQRHFANAWCNGSPGIGLSRLESWAALGRADEELMDEAYMALAATMRSFTRTGNDTLCHGGSGNAELLLRFATVRDEPGFQLEANIHAQARFRRLARTPDWPRMEGGREAVSGLMVGTAGIGMHFLRLAHPERIPSPLLLDPPPTPR